MLNKSIDFLLENAGCVIQYRLRKEILQNISKIEEENLLEEIYQTPYFKMVESYTKPSGFIGHGIHGHSNFPGRCHETPLQDGETAARLLACYAVPRENPLVVEFVVALKDDSILEYEIAYNKTNRITFSNRHKEITSGNGWLLPVYTMQTLLGHGEDSDVQPFLDICLDAFGRVLQVNSLTEILTYKPEHKLKYNWPYVDNNSLYPCQYHMTILAHTESWRTPTTTKMLADSINTIDELTTEDNEIVQLFKDKGMSGLGQFNKPFTPYTTNPGEWLSRQYLTEMAMLGVGRNANVLRITSDYLEEQLADSGILHGGKAPSHRYPSAYADIYLEPNYRKKTAHSCDLTFWAVQFLHYMNR